MPNYLEYEIAVLKSNVAACHLKLADWKAAVDEATKSLEALDRLDGPPPTPNPSDKKDERAADRVEKDTGEKGDDDGVVELADDDGDEGEALEKLQKDDRRKDDIRRIRIKALMRRARARTEQGGWGNLQGALEGMIPPSPLLPPSASPPPLPPHQTNSLPPSQRLPTPLHLPPPIPPPPPLLHFNSPHRSLHPPRPDLSSERKGNGGDDGEAEGVGEWDSEAVWVEHREFSVREG